MDYSSVLRVIGVAMLKAVEMSSQEATWLLLRKKMPEKSHDVIHILTFFPEQLVRVRKTSEERQGSPASTDVPVVIGHRHYTQDTTDDCKRENVLLYVSFRSEAVDVLNNYNSTTIQEEEAPPPLRCDEDNDINRSAVHIDPDQDGDLVSNENLLRLIKETSIGAPPIRVFFTGPAGCGKTLVLRLAMDMYNRYNDSNPYNEFVICASTGKAAVAIDDIKHDPLITKADILCITETWNARRPYIDGFLPVVCTTDAYHPAAGVSIHMKLIMSPR
ncbi:hypothetical protein HPB52_017424 [Rhipicephalus sanguineus]|uniref:Uncharacterized protein n=1 Tax=Rhipicephalus sanguineus TaxID=34632 RepID=A0A9D4PJK2_RHISA|nr:hypothetical protein HPB52_017424 [Rhipicephalus sanguineus]